MILSSYYLCYVDGFIFYSVIHIRYSVLWLPPMLILLLHLRIYVCLPILFSLLSDLYFLSSFSLPVKSLFSQDSLLTHTSLISSHMYLLNTIILDIRAVIEHLGSYIVVSGMGWGRSVGPEWNWRVNWSITHECWIRNTSEAPCRQGCERWRAHHRCYLNKLMPSAWTNMSSSEKKRRKILLQAWLVEKEHATIGVDGPS